MELREYWPDTPQNTAEELSALDKEINALIEIYTSLEHEKEAASKQFSIQIKDIMQELMALLKWQAMKYQSSARHNGISKKS